MRYMPLFFDVTGREILIIGGGRVALRRARQFSEAGARLTVIAPEILSEFSSLPATTLLCRGAVIDDLQTKFIFVIIASSNVAVNAAIAAACREKNMLFSRCDSFTDGNFICGSMVAKGDITCSAVSGGVPAISKYLQNRIEALIRPELVELASVLTEIRPQVKASGLPEAAKADFMARWVTDAVLDRIANEGIEKIREEINACL